MIYDPSLKDKVQVLALDYFDKNNVGLSSEKELNKLEEKMVYLIENYVFSYCIKCSNTDDIEDYKQSARVGIVTALRTYNPIRGHFCTWVIWHSRNNVIRNRTQECIKIPNYVKEKIRKIRFFEHEFLKNNNRLPDENEILEGTSISKVDYKKTRFFEELSIEEIDSTENSKTPRKDNLILENNTFNMLYFDILREIECLEPIQKNIFFDYFIENNTVSELSKKYNLKSNTIYTTLGDIRDHLKLKLEDTYFN